MYKILTYDTVDDTGIHAYTYDPDQGLEKTASEFSSELKDFLDTLEKKANQTYILVNALSAGEYFGANKNGDYFSEDVLLKYHKTFEALARPYKHHINKDLNESYGRVLFASYNPAMHRVELVIELDNVKAVDIIQRVINGENVAVSMGCKVPYDVCSICKHIAKKVIDYCEHLKRPNMGMIYPDGRQAYAINTMPKFFDISFVGIPADETAGVMLKVAGQQAYSLSAELGEKFLKDADMKESQIVKEIEPAGEIEAISSDPKNLIFDSQPEIPKEDLIAVCKKYSLSEILSTFLGLRLMPKPQDFQRLILYKVQKQELADYCDRNKLIFPMDMEPIYPEDVGYHKFNPILAKEIQHLIPTRSLTKPLIIIRVMQKRADLAAEGQMGDRTDNPPVRDYWTEVKKQEIRKSPIKNPFFALITVGGLYAAWQKMMSLGGNLPIGQLEQLLLKYPWLWPLLLGGTALGATMVQKEFIAKEASFIPDLSDLIIKRAASPAVGRTLTSILLGVPATYMYAGYQESKVRKGQPIGKLENLIRKHPFLTSLVSVFALRKGLKHLPYYKKASFEDVIYNLNSKALDSVYQDVISM